MGQIHGGRYTGADTQGQVHEGRYMRADSRGANTSDFIQNGDISETLPYVLIIYYCSINCITLGRVGTSNLQ